MSADFLIYTDRLEEFDRADFEGWCKRQGYEVELHPDFDLWQGGFVPMRFRAPFLGKGSFLTGFELDCAENDFLDMTAAVYEPPVKKQGFFARLFGKKPQPLSIPPEYKTAPAPEMPSPFEQAAGEKKWQVCCCCHAVEPLAELMASYKEWGMEFIPFTGWENAEF